MTRPRYTLSKLLPLVLLSSCISVGITYIFRIIALNPLYSQIIESSYGFVPALIATPILIILFYLFATHLKSGLPHVVLEFHIGLGRLPFLNFLFQFLSASVALLMGFAIGSIGPAVHIGAASANLVGQFFIVRSHTLRVLTACGASVAITVMLDTPLMAILFTYETIIRQFRWRTLALVTVATLFAQGIGHKIGIAPLHIALPEFSLSPSLLGLILLFGLICGLISAFFLNSIDFLIQRIRLSYWKKMMMAGGITALLSTYYPETVGLGYTLLNSILSEQQLIEVLLLWFVIRFIASLAMVSLAIPGGILSPSLILGALTGAFFTGLLSIEIPQLFIVIGMGAFLGAVLHVPLAGILFVLEVTHDITLLLPCVLASYSAYYLHQHFCPRNNLIELLLFRQKVILRDSPSLKKKRLTSPL